MSKENPYHDILKRQDDKLKLAVATRFLLGSKAFSNRPVPTLLFFGTAAVLGEAFVRYGVHEEYNKAVRAGAADSYPGPLTMLEAEDITVAAEGLYNDAKQTYNFFKKASDYVDSSETLKKFYPKPEKQQEPQERSWWRPW